MGKPGHVWARFGPNDEFHSRPIQSTYYALTFSEKIRKNKNQAFGLAKSCFVPHIDLTMYSTVAIILSIYYSLTFNEKIGEKY